MPKRKRAPAQPDEQIKKVKTDSQAKPVFLNPYYDHKIIPNHPFRLLLSGSGQSGKTTLLISLLTNKHFYKEFFDQFIVISPNVYHEQWDIVHEKLGNKLITFDDFSASTQEEIKKILNRQKTLVEEEGRFAPSILFVFDDCVSENEVLHSKILKQLFTRGRHDNFSMIFVTQYYNGFPLKLRKQLTNLIQFPTANKEEVEAIQKEYGHRKLTKEEFHQMFNMITDKPYQFMHINLQCSDPNVMYRKKFQEIMEIIK